MKTKISNIVSFEFENQKKHLRIPYYFTIKAEQSTHEQDTLSQDTSNACHSFLSLLHNKTSKTVKETFIILKYSSKQKRTELFNRVEGTLLKIIKRKALKEIQTAAFKISAKMHFRFFR